MIPTLTAASTYFTTVATPLPIPSVLLQLQADLQLPFQSSRITAEDACAVLATANSTAIPKAAAIVAVGPPPSQHQQ